MAGAGATSPWGRFDDLVAGTGLRFAASRQVLVARQTAEVVPALTAVGEAAERGCWAFGYVSYEAAAGLDAGLATVTSPGDGPPLVWFAVCEQPEQVPPIALPPGSRRRYTTSWRAEWTRPGYRRDVARLRGHIAAGDVYQGNLTSRLRSAVRGDLQELYADLAHSQRPRYAAYLDLGRHVIASASPELFFDWTGDRLLTRPMKGTAARGRSLPEDEDRARRLRGNAKERAENIMIVDLLRNDLGRIADVGSVQVPALCALERYETVWQLTSDVTATLPASTGLVDVFRALFPSGSVTGAPKRRAMQLIRDLEDTPRGVYCGAVGFVAPPAAAVRARFNVAIRTAVIDRPSASAVYGTGSAITWASDPDAEFAELHAKAAILHSPAEEFDLLETLACLPQEGVRHLDRHLERLSSSARYFGFPLDSEHARRHVLTAVRGRAAPAKVRVLLSRDGTLRVELEPLPVVPDRPVTLAVDSEPVNSRDRWLHHKTTRRHAYTTRAARHPEADDVVLINERGQVTETTIANLAVQLDGTWLTPPTNSGCLAGIERARLLELGRLREGTITMHQLHHAQNLAVLSSLRGWRPALLTPLPTP